jgi:hypothetical protein
MGRLLHGQDTRTPDGDHYKDCEKNHNGLVIETNGGIYTPNNGIIF